MLKVMPKLRSQHGLAAYTPCTWYSVHTKTNGRTVAIFRAARLEPIKVPTRYDWLVFFATCGTDLEFAYELLKYLKDQPVRRWLHLLRSPPNRLDLSFISLGYNNS